MFNKTMTWFYNMHLCCALGFERCKYRWGKIYRCCRLKGSLSTTTHVTTESCSSAHARHDHGPSFTCPLTLLRQKIGEGTRTYLYSISTTWAPSWNELHWVCFFLSRIWMFCPKAQIAAAKQVFYSSLNFPSSGRRSKRRRRRTM